MCPQTGEACADLGGIAHMDYSSTCGKGWQVPNSCTFACVKGFTPSGTLMTCKSANNYTANRGPVPPACIGTAHTPMLVMVVCGAKVSCRVA